MKHNRPTLKLELIRLRAKYRRELIALRRKYQVAKRASFTDDDSDSYDEYQRLSGALIYMESVYLDLKRITKAGVPSAPKGVLNEAPSTHAPHRRARRWKTAPLVR